MFMSYRELRSSLFPRKCAPQKEHSMVVSSDKLKFSIKEIFVKRNKAKVRCCYYIKYVKKPIKNV